MDETDSTPNLRLNLPKCEVLELCYVAAKNHINPASLRNLKRFKFKAMNDADLLSLSEEIMQFPTEVLDTVDIHIECLSMSALLKPLSFDYFLSKIIKTLVISTNKLTLPFSFLEKVEGSLAEALGFKFKVKSNVSH